MMSYKVGGLAKLFAKKNKGKVVELTEGGRRLDELFSKKGTLDGQEKVSKNEEKSLFGFKKRKRESSSNEEIITKKMKKSMESSPMQTTDNAVTNSGSISKKKLKKLKRLGLLPGSEDDKAIGPDQQSPRSFKDGNSKNENADQSLDDSRNEELMSRAQAKKQKKQKGKRDKFLSQEETAVSTPVISLDEDIENSGNDGQNSFVPSKKGKKKNRKAKKKDRSLHDSDENEDGMLNNTVIPIEYAERNPGKKISNKIDVIHVDSEGEVFLIPSPCKKPSKQSIRTASIPQKTRKEPKHCVDDEMDTNFESVLANMDDGSLALEQSPKKKKKRARGTEIETLDAVDPPEKETAEECNPPENNSEQNFSKQASLNRLKEELKKKARKFREKRDDDMASLSADPTKSEKKRKKRSDVPGISEKPKLLKFSARAEESPEKDDSSCTGQQQDEEEKKSSPKKKKRSKSPEAALEKDHVPIEDSPEKKKRTLFFGNIPVSMKKKAVKQVFQQYGDVESIRFRSFIPVKPKISKKLTEIREECHENVTSNKGYVVFKTFQDAEKALALNGIMVNGNHMRVDRAFSSGQQKSDNNRTVFVGNLPFNIDDETLWSTFSTCGTVEYTRIIRDKNTGLGRGFGFIQFKDASSVKAALKLNDTEVSGRTIRVKTCDKDSGGSMPKGPKPFGFKKGATKRGPFNVSSKRKGFPRRDFQGSNQKSKKKLLKQHWRDRDKKRVASIFKPFCDSITNMSKSKKTQSS